ncbi:hypothetical protein [Francisella uliginis]|uniref:hypothetical protein n=1 Tax=Francisella uliginis TaxID=573570 RepID=UPI00156A8E86|nr:hypothetical protein [Francisella uliginis]
MQNCLALSYRFVANQWWLQNSLCSDSCSNFSLISQQLIAMCCENQKIMRFSK